MIISCVKLLTVQHSTLNLYCQARVQVPNPLSQQAPNPNPKVRPSLKNPKTQFFGLGWHNSHKTTISTGSNVQHHIHWLHPITPDPLAPPYNCCHPTPPHPQLLSMRSNEMSQVRIPKSDHCIWWAWINHLCKSGLDPINCKSSLSLDQNIHDLHLLYIIAGTDYTQVQNVKKASTTLY